MHQAEIGSTRYLTPAAALGKAKRDEMVKLLANQGLTPQAMNCCQGFSIQEMNGNTVSAAINGTRIDVAANGAITLRSGEVNVRRETDTDHCITVDGYQLTAPVDYKVKAVDKETARRTVEQVLPLLQKIEF